MSLPCTVFESDSPIDLGDRFRSDDLIFSFHKRIVLTIMPIKHFEDNICFGFIQFTNRINRYLIYA